MIRQRNFTFTLKKLHDAYGMVTACSSTIRLSNITKHESNNLSGPVVRLGPSDISFATISAYDTIYGAGADKYFAISGSRRSLLVNTRTMTDVLLSSCLGKEPRSWLRPIVVSTLGDLTGAGSERAFNSAFEDGLRSHCIGRTPSTPIDLSTFHQDYVWALGDLLAFGRKPKLFSRGG
jgi:hypothetical protein